MATRFLTTTESIAANLATVDGNAYPVAPEDEPPPPSPVGGAVCVDLVDYGGADPTGTVDCSAAFNKCFALLAQYAADPILAATTLQLCIPYGKFLLTTPPNVCQPQAGALSRLRVTGQADQSIVLVDVGAGNTALFFLNWSFIDVDAVSFQGVQTGAAADCGIALQVAPESVAKVSRCHFSYLTASTAVLYANAGHVIVDQCWVGGCGGAGASNIFGTGCKLSVRDCFISDFPGINGDAPATKAGAQVQIQYVGQSTVFLWQGLEILNCFVDEDCDGSVVIAGGGANVDHVYLRDNWMLSPQGGGTGVSVTDVNWFELDGHTVEVVTGSGGAAVALFGVAHARLKGLVVDNAHASNFVTADAATGYVDVVESPTLLTANITLASAATGLTIQNGTPAANFVSARNAVDLGPAPDVNFSSPSIKKLSTGSVLVTATLSGTLSAADAVVLLLYRDGTGGTQLPPVSLQNLGAGYFTGTLCWVDTLPDRSPHTYTIRAYTYDGANTITVGKASDAAPLNLSSASVSAVEVWGP